MLNDNVCQTIGYDHPLSNNREWECFILFSLARTLTIFFFCGAYHGIIERAFTANGKREIHVYVFLK